MIDAIVADNEAHSRQRIRELLQPHADIDVLCECSDGSTTVQAIKKLNPQLVFLDIEMPELDGFGVLSSVEPIPAVIFVAAQEQHAVAAFEARVLDYLLKPFQRSRFDQALERARTRIRELEDLAKHSTNSPDRSLLIIRVDGKTVFLQRSDVECIKAERDYALVCVGNSEYLIRESLSSIMRRLDDRFLRIHRSAIANLEHVREVQALYAGDARLDLASGRQLTLSRTHRRSFEEFMHRHQMRRAPADSVR